MMGECAMKKRRILLSLLVPSVALFWSCQGLQQLIQPPSVSVANVAMQDITFETVTLDFDLKVHNPNAFGASLQGFDYKFSLLDKELFSGNNSSSFSIPAQGDGHAHIPITLNFKEVYKLIQETSSLDTIAFHIAGNLRPGGLLAGITLPFSKTGTVPNIRIPEVALGGLKIDKLSLSGIDMKLAIKVKNPNTFAFDIGKMNYAIKLAGQTVASGLSHNLASLPQKGTGEIQLPIKLDFAGVTSSLRTALTGGSIDCAVAGGADLNTPFGLLNLPLQAAQKITIFK
jgi:LEA14-like dessication related protein